MNLKEHYAVCAAEEAGEISEIAYELAKVALKMSKSFHKGLRFGFTDINPETGLTKLEMLKNEYIDLRACLELLQEVGVLPFNLDNNREAVEAKKTKIQKYLKISRANGTLTD